MPSFTFTSPEGKSYTVNGPEGSTQEQAWAILQQQIGGSTAPVEQKKPEERTWAEAGQDIGAGLIQGAGALIQLPSQLYGLATGDLEDTGVLKAGRELSEFGDSLKSKALKEKEANRAELIARAEQEGGQLAAFGTAFFETMKDPALLTSFLAEQAPQLLVPFGAAKVGKAAVLAKGAGAVQAGAVGTAAAIGAGAVQQGADVGAQAYENIYKELISKGATEQEAKDGAINLARATGASASMISLIAQKLPGARTLEETFAGVPGKAGRAIGTVKGAAGEAASEIVEETGGKFTENLALREVKPEQSLTEGLGQTAGMAAVGGVGMGGVAGALRRPGTPDVRRPPELPPEVTPPAAAEVAPPSPPVANTPPPVISDDTPVDPTPPITKPDGTTFKYWEIPDDIQSEVLPNLVIQNRDRSTQASIAQINDIAANLDYGRVSTSRDFGNGAPVVISDFEIPAEQIGSRDIAVAANGKRIPFVYAVVSANDITPSNDATGSNIPKYQDLSVPTIRPIAGNGRVAGIQAAYERGTANDYTEQLLKDTNTGINPQALAGIQNPVLVRVMPKTFLTPNIGDISNISSTARLSPVDTAKNDTNRFDLGGLEFNEDGTASPKTLMQFINAMPVEERGELTDKNGRPTSQALDRLANAVFFKAYGSESLIDLYAQAADPEAKTILNALARVAPKMAQLEGAGEYDVRQAVIQAAEAAVNARRAGVNLAAFAKQGDINMDPNAAEVLTMFGENGRSAKKISERLEALAETAYKQSQAGTDMFGEVPKVPLSEIFGVLKQSPDAGGLFEEPPVKEKPAVKEKPVKKEKPEFVIDKTEYQIEQELKGKSMAYFINWLVDNAPNSAAKHIAEKIKARIDLYAKRGVKMEFKVLTGTKRTRSRQGVMKSKIINGRLQHEIQLNGTKNGTSDWMTATNYETGLHEALHLATSLQIKANPTSKEVQELSSLLRVVKSQIAKDKKAGSEDPVVKAAARGANIVANERELVAWGLSNSDFQKYLSKIELSEKQTAFTKFIDILRNLLGINSQYKTALEKLAEVTDTLMDVPIDELAAQLGKVGWKIGQDRTSKEGTVDLGEEGKADYVPPKLRTDNPGGEWLKNKREQSIEDGKKKSGVPIRFGSVTGTFREGNKIRKPLIPVEVLARLQGMNDEQNNVRQKDLDAIKKIMDETGRLPKAPDGSDYVPFINVYQDGTAYVNEGNHRIMAAKALGFKYLPVEISYFNGAELIEDGDLSPKNVIGYDLQARDDKITLDNYRSEKKPKIEDKPDADIPFNIERKQTSTQAFKKWFGNSKITNEDGSPKVMYHGTSRDISKFKPGQADAIFLTDSPRFAERFSKLSESTKGKVDFESLSVDQEIKVLRQAMKMAKEEGIISSAKLENIEDVIAQGELPKDFYIKSGLSDLIDYILGAQGGENIIPVYVKSEKPFDYDNPNHLDRLSMYFGDDSVTMEELADGNWSAIEDPQVQEAIQALGFDGFYVMEEGKKNLAVYKSNQIKSAIGNKGTFSTESEMIDESVKGAFEYGKNKLRKVLQKRNIKEGAFTDVDQGLVDIAKPIFFPRNKTIIERLEDLKGDFWKKVSQGIADQYRTIKDYSHEAYMMARMSKTVDGALEGLMFFGQVYDNNGALDIKANTKGLIAAMEPVGQEVDRYQMWVALNREAQLPADKRSKMANMDELIRRRNEFADGMIDGKPRLEVYEQVRKDMNQINRSVLKVALDKGLIDEKAYDRFINDINYIPFYRHMEDGDLQGASTSTGLTNQYFSKELKGGESPYGDLMENTLRNWSHILSASMKNAASNATINAAIDFGAAIPNLKAQYDLVETEDGTVVINKSTGEIVGDGTVKPEMTIAGKGMIKTMVDGQPMYHQVLDPMLVDSISAIAYTGPKSKFLDVARDFKNMLQFGVTVSPAFKIRNLFRDSISALAVTDLKKNPFANVIEGWAASNRNNPAHISALAGGAIFNFGTAYEGDQSKLIKRLLDSGVREEDILDSPEKIQKGLSIMWEKYKDWGNKSESANRMALYNQLKEQGMNHLEASFYARDLLDFSMQGTWPAFRLAAQTIPFLNARVQGLYKLGRDGIVPTSRVLYNTITGKEITATDAQKARSFGYTTLAVAMASMLLYLAFKDDEEYKKREAWDRDNFWWFRLPGMDKAVRIPKPFEIGAFGTMAERVLEQIVDKDAEGKQFGDSVFRMLTDTFAINPMPQIIRPVLDLYANRDSFTGAPIESAGMERLSKQERQTDASSPIAQALGGVSSILGDKLELSPVQVDYAIKAYFGWLGGTATQMSVYATLPFRDGAYPDTNWVDKGSQGFIKSLPATQSRYVTAFYENNKEISQAFADMRHFAQLGQADKVQEIMEKKGDKIILNNIYDQTAKEMANIRKQIRLVTNDSTMDGEFKRETIDRMKRVISELAENAEELRKATKK
jgi:hypothetical protein